VFGSSYDVLTISLLITPLEEQNPGSSLNFKVSACRAKQAFVKEILVHPGDSHDINI